MSVQEEPFLPGRIVAAVLGTVVIGYLIFMVLDWVFVWGLGFIVLAWVSGLLGLAIALGVLTGLWIWVWEGTGRVQHQKDQAGKP